MNKYRRFDWTIENQTFESLNWTLYQSVIIFLSCKRFQIESDTEFCLSPHFRMIIRLWGDRARYMKLNVDLHCLIYLEYEMYTKTGRIIFIGISFIMICIEWNGSEKYYGFSVTRHLNNVFSREKNSHK